jgi:hypothetical protein
VLGSDAEKRRRGHPVSYSAFRNPHSAMGSCRHTEPDWLRYVREPGEGFPIFAACKLLLKEGEAAEDPRTLACGYWGRQPECPLYEGPARPAPRIAEAAPAAPPAREVPLTARQMGAARLSIDDYARLGPLTEAMRQRRRASAAALALLAALAVLAAWLLR